MLHMAMSSMCGGMGQKITAGALGMELAAVAVLGSTIVAFDYLSSKDD